MAVSWMLHEESQGQCCLCLEATGQRATEAGEAALAKAQMLRLPSKPQIRGPALLPLC